MSKLDYEAHVFYSDGFSIKACLKSLSDALDYVDSFENKEAYLVIFKPTGDIVAHMGVLVNSSYKG